MKHWTTKIQIVLLIVLLPVFLYGLSLLNYADWSLFIIGIFLSIASGFAVIFIIYSLINKIIQKFKNKQS